MEVTIYTDGACSGNPGPGGWGAILLTTHERKEICGGEIETTNNRMELTAAIRGLQSLDQSATVELYTDSRYVIDGITKWISAWKANGWRTSSKKSVKNEDLWRILDNIILTHEVKWHWVKGHSGDIENDRADGLARAGITKAISEINT
jgi:ribonuclease HI